MTTDDLATRMYAQADTPKTPSTAPGASSGQSTARTPSPRESAADRAGATFVADKLYGGAQPEPVEPLPLTVEEVVAQEPQTLAERMYADQDAPEGTDYGNALSRGFDGLEHQARFDGNDEDQAALAAGRKEAAAVLADMRVSLPVASEITRALADWHSRPPMDEDAIDASRDRAEKTLRKEWGRSYDANVKLAQQAGLEACKRLPWLADLFANGAGNDPELIRHFAQIGLRSARRARR